MRAIIHKSNHYLLKTKSILIITYKKVKARNTIICVKTRCNLLWKWGWCNLCKFIHRICIQIWVCQCKCQFKEWMGVIFNKCHNSLYPVYKQYILYRACKTCRECKTYREYKICKAFKECSLCRAFITCLKWIWLKCKCLVIYIINQFQFKIFKKKIKWNISKFSKTKCRKFR